MPMFASSVMLVNWPTTDSATSTALPVQLPIPPVPLVLPVMPPATPALSTPASAQVAPHAADHSSTSSALPLAQLVPTPSTEPASTAHTAALLALEAIPPVHHAPQERSFTTVFVMTSAPTS
jgi:hypothetical protein